MLDLIHASDPQKLRKNPTWFAFALFATTALVSRIIFLCQASPEDSHVPPATMDAATQQNIVDLQEAQKATDAQFAKFEAMIGKLVEKMVKKSAPSSLGNHPPSNQASLSTLSHTLPNLK